MNIYECDLEQHLEWTPVKFDLLEDIKKFWPTLNKDGLCEIVFSIIKFKKPYIYFKNNTAKLLIEETLEFF